MSDERATIVAETEADTGTFTSRTCPAPVDNLGIDQVAPMGNQAVQRTMASPGSRSRIRGNQTAARAKAQPPRPLGKFERHLIEVNGALELVDLVKSALFPGYRRAVDAIDVGAALELARNVVGALQVAEGVGRRVAPIIAATDYHQFPVSELGLPEEDDDEALARPARAASCPGGAMPYNGVCLTDEILDAIPAYGDVHAAVGIVKARATEKAAQARVEEKYAKLPDAALSKKISEMRASVEGRDTVPILLGRLEKERSRRRALPISAPTKVDQAIAMLEEAWSLVEKEQPPDIRRARYLVHVVNNWLQKAAPPSRYDECFSGMFKTTAMQSVGMAKGNVADMEHTFSSIGGWWPATINSLKAARELVQIMSGEMKIEDTEVNASSRRINRASVATPLIGMAVMAAPAVIVAVPAIPALPGTIGGVSTAVWGQTLFYFMLSVNIGLSYDARSKEAAASEEGSNPLSIAFATMLDAIGLSRLFQAATKQSILTGEDLHFSETEQVLGVLLGSFELFMNYLGAKGLVGGGTPAFEPPPRVAARPPETPPVVATPVTDVGETVAAVESGAATVKPSAPAAPTPTETPAPTPTMTSTPEPAPTATPAATMRSSGPVASRFPSSPMSRTGSTWLGKVFIKLHLGVTEAVPATGEVSAGYASGPRPVPALKVPFREPVATGLEPPGSILQNAERATAAAGELAPDVPLKSVVPDVPNQGPLAEPTMSGQQTPTLAMTPAPPLQLVPSPAPALQLAEGVFSPAAHPGQLPAATEPIVEPIASGQQAATSAAEPVPTAGATERLREIEAATANVLSQMRALETKIAPAQGRWKVASADAAKAKGAREIALSQAAARNNASVERWRSEVDALRLRLNALTEVARRLRAPTMQAQTWQQAEDLLRQEFGGRKQTLPAFTKAGEDLGERDIDCFTDDGTSREAKFGYQGLSARLKEEIAKDVALLEARLVKRVEWHFYENPNTGSIGHSPKLRTALNDANIWIVIHKKRM